MKLRQFWKAMMWWSKGVRHHPLYKKITLDDISKIEYLANKKHEKRVEIIIPESCHNQVGRRDLHLSVDWSTNIDKVEKCAEEFYEFITKIDSL